jgi:hypothetical protein
MNMIDDIETRSDSLGHLTMANQMVGVI